MKDRELLRAIEAFKQIRELTNEHLPVDHSFIPYDILLQVCAAHEMNERISIKGLFSKLPFSDMGIRYHFERLVKDGWIELTPDQTDGRVKLAVPSEKLIERFRALVQGYQAYESALVQSTETMGAQRYRLVQQPADRTETN